MEGSVFARRLGLHLHAAVHEGRLRRVGIHRAPSRGQGGPEVAPILDALARHCETGRESFREFPLDLAGLSAFDREVLQTLAREVAPGEVVTYGELARMVGKGPAVARAVGGAMARNPMPIVVPCHRVIPAGGRIGNYSGEGGWETKMALLRIEGAPGVWAQTQLS